jgi:alanyl-tRNA synthetase
MKGHEIRSYFLNFFKQRGHAIVASSSLVPKDDPTLLFTNAGMVQFKKVFLGEEKRDYTRAATSQKCVRAGGKHNDLENVGWTARHHTFFEMLGNFSFGDYFKEGAIEMAWDLLVGEFGLPKERLWVTIHEGDQELGVGPDDEARRLWERYLPPDRIVACPTKDNFWQMGDTGPCGPCSEILIDQGEEVGCRRPQCAVGCDCDRYLELWNLVFMQYNRDEQGNLVPLPRPSIDTGMGLERIAAVLQGKFSNYETDLFMPLIEAIEEISGITYKDDTKKDVSIRVVADHARGVTFLIGDGVIPSNEGRGYVLRRIIRRAARHGRLLGLNEPFLHKISQRVIDEMKSAYPELEQRRAAITQIIQREEERFAETLDKGLRILEEEEERLRSMGMNVIPGEVVFRLYDTYGFPVDLTADVARENGFTIDEEGFHQAMEVQRARAREAWTGSGEAEVPEVYRRVASRGIRSAFTGYEELSTLSEVCAIIVDGQEVQRASSSQEAIEVITARTPFYGEAGGQVGDKGLITADGVEMEVTETLRPVEELIVHRGVLKRGELRVGDEVILRVDEALRADTARNHSATHILQSVLREVLGEVVQQAGSKVTPDGFRFDYHYPFPVDREELELVEQRVNERIRENQPVTIHIMPYREAITTGAIAIFEEKYGDVVRVVEMGDFSRELCGGTHVRSTGEVGFFKIVSERSISADTRRIEALTGRGAVLYIQEQQRRLEEAARLLKAAPGELEEKIVRLLERQRELEGQIKALQAKIASGQSRDLLQEAMEVGGVKILATEVDMDDPRSLGELADRLRDRLGSGIVLLGAKAQNKAMLTISVSDDLKGRFPAGQLIKEVARVVGGSGGGKSHFAQGGGPHIQRLKEALEELRRAVERAAG